MEKDARLDGLSAQHAHLSRFAVESPGLKQFHDLPKAVKRCEIFDGRHSLCQLQPIFYALSDGSGG